MDFAEWMDDVIRETDRALEIGPDVKRVLYPEWDWIEALERGITPQEAVQEFFSGAGITII